MSALREDLPIETTVNGDPVQLPDDLATSISFRPTGRWIGQRPPGVLRWDVDAHLGADVPDDKVVVVGADAEVVVTSASDPRLPAAGQRTGVLPRTARPADRPARPAAPQGSSDLGERAMKGTAAALLLVLAWPSSLPAQTNAGRVVRGVKAQVVTVEVTNEGPTAPIEPALRIAAQPPWISNVRIVPDSSGPLPPGRTRRFAVSFDVAADAPEGALAALEFEVSDPAGERFDNPAPEVTVQVMDTRLVLSSLTLDGRTLDGPSSAERSSRKQAAWDVIAGTSFSNQTTKAIWLLTGAPRLPAVIRLGEDFSIGLCGGVALRNEGGEPPRPVDRFQHKTLLAASALRRFNQARSYPAVLAAATTRRAGPSGAGSWNPLSIRSGAQRASRPVRLSCRRATGG